MPSVYSKIANTNLSLTTIDWSKTGNQLIFDLYEAIGRFDMLKIVGVKFKDITPTFLASFLDVDFVNCTFDNCDFGSAYFSGCTMEKCKVINSPNSEWLEALKKIGEKMKPILTPTNEEIARLWKCKVYSLPNKSFVKIKWTCDFCHRDYYEVYRRDRISSPLCEVPNCDRKVCGDCYSQYRLREKFQGNRIYGYHGEIHKYKTPMDASNTAILGLEMEFEGDFYGWKELQDAHKNFLHYGYDSSVIGQNELSWDCGSYSWWKYLSPLKDVCEVVGKFGGRAGDTAGIHIHVSRDDVDMRDITNKINAFGQTPCGGALFKAISLRNNRERFDMYSNLSCSMEAHHAGISYNSYRTCEFRLFNSTLDYLTILKHLKFCKEVFNAFADGVDVWKGFSKETVKHILECAKIEKDKGFITEEEYDSVIEKLK